MNEVACIAKNVSGAGRRRRAVLGIVALAVALGAFWWIVLRQPAWPQRLLVGVPLFVAGLGLFQAQAST